MDYRFHTLDVFTSHRFGGNPLAVLPDAKGLDTAAMQRIAREFNLSETTFVLPPHDPANTADIRIFTPMAELPFAGHPTVGTAVLLAELAEPGNGAFEREVRLEEKVGLLRVVVRRDAQGATFGQFSNAVLPKPDGAAPDAAAIAAALSLSDVDIGGAGHAPACVNAGNTFLFVPVANLDAVGRAALDMAGWRAIAEGRGWVGAFIYCKGGISAQAQFHGRMLSTGFGVPEDPATGSAAATFPGQVAACETLGDGTHKWFVEQGYEMGRPSLIELSLEVEGGRLGTVRIGGHAVRVAEGRIEV
jgi:trans-2,3-dihydro-3-hydroxyanthranilate isomerase